MCGIVSVGQFTITFPEHALARLGKGPISDVSAAPDGRWLAVASSMGVEIRDGTTVEFVSFIPIEATIVAIALSPNGSLLAAASDDGLIRLFQVPSGKEIGTLVGHTNCVTSVSFSPDGKTLASISTDGTVRIWDVAQRAEACEYGVRVPGLSCYSRRPRVAFSPRGQIIAYSTSDGTINVLDLAQSRVVITLKAWGIEFIAGDIAFSPNGELLAGGFHTGFVKIWDVTSGELVHSFGGHARSVDSVAFSRDGSLVCSGSYDGKVVVRNLLTGRVLSTFDLGWGGIPAIVPLTYNRFAIASSNDNSLTIYDGTKKQGQKIQTDHTGAVVSLTASSQTNIVVSANWPRTLLVWNQPPEEAHAIFELLNCSPSQVALNSDGSLLVACLPCNATIRAWDLASRNEIWRNEREYGVRCIAIHPSGRLLAVGGKRGVRFLDIFTGRVVRNLGGLFQGVMSLKFSGDGEILVAGTDSGKIAVWETGQWNLRAILGVSSDRRLFLHEVVISPDGTRVASLKMSSSREDGILSVLDVWDLIAQGVDLVIRDPDNDLIYSVAFSPDGNFLIGGTQNGALDVWDSHTGDVVARLLGHRRRVTSLAFSEDGSLLLSGALDGTIIVWDFASVMAKLVSEQQRE
jgi:WD40 repeat protein